MNPGKNKRSFFGLNHRTWFIRDQTNPNNHTTKGQKKIHATLIVIVGSYGGLKNQSYRQKVSKESSPKKEKVEIF